MSQIIHKIAYVSCGSLLLSLQGLAAQFLVSLQRLAPWQTTCQPHGSCVVPLCSQPSPLSWGSSCLAVSTPTCRGPYWWVQQESPHTTNIESVQTYVVVETGDRITLQKNYGNQLRTEVQTGGTSQVFYKQLFPSLIFLVL